LPKAFRNAPCGARINPQGHILKEYILETDNFCGIFSRCNAPILAPPNPLPRGCPQEFVLKEYFSRETPHSVPN
jgi:hypothetical protein